MKKTIPQKLTSIVLSFVITLFVITPLFSNVVNAVYEHLFPINDGHVAYVYGYSSNYDSGNTFHYGIDIHYDGDDDTVYSACNGTVVQVSNPCNHWSQVGCGHYNTYGNCIKVHNEDGTYSIYGHLSQNTSLVNVGESVKKGQALAIMGSTGDSTGKHLHYEVRTSTSQSTAINTTPGKGVINYTYTGYGASAFDSCIELPSDTYYLKNKSTGEYLTIDSNKYDSNISLKEFNGGEMQKFILKGTNKSYTLSAVFEETYNVNPYYTDKKMFVNGANLTLYYSNKESKNDQHWSIIASNGGYLIRNRNNASLVIGQSGENAQMETRSGIDSQIWVFESATNGKIYTTPDFDNIKIDTYYLKNKSTGTYLTIDKKEYNSNISVSAYNGSETQKFVLGGAVGKTYTLKPSYDDTLNVNPYWYSKIPYGEGNNITLYYSKDETDNDQHWAFEAVSGGYILHNMKNDRFVIGLDGNNAQLETKTGADDQIWILESATHIHDFSEFVYFSTEHPHYKCYKCSCGEIKESKDEPTFVNTCSTCLESVRPKIPVITDCKYLYGKDETITINWNGAPENVSYYNLYIQLYVDGEYIPYKTYTEIKEQSYSFSLPEGNYRALVLAFNEDYYEANGAEILHSEISEENCKPFSVGDSYQIFFIDYNSNGGKNAPEVQSKFYGLDMTLSSIIPEKTETVTFFTNGGTLENNTKVLNYVFLGWGTEPIASGVIYQPGDKFTLDKDTILYAQWATPQIGEMPTPTRAGCEFLGWYSDINDGILTQYNADSVISGDTVMFAHWSGDEYAVTFLSDDGITVTNTVIGKTGTTIKIPDAVPEKEGYTFVSWVSNDYYRYAEKNEFKPGDNYEIGLNDRLLPKWEEEIHVHTFGEWTKLNDTQHKRTCECGETETDNHTWDAGKVTKAATHLEAGVKTYTCTVCGATKTEVIPKNNTHKFGEWTKLNDTQHKRTCECGETETENHVWDGGRITKEPTYTESGEMTYTCTVCGGKKTEIIKPLDKPIDENTPRIDIENVKASAGKEVKVKISLKNNPGIASLKLVVTYDPALTLTGIEYGDELGGMAQEPEKLDSPVILNWFNGKANTYGDIVYATLTFTVSENAEAGKKLGITAVYDQDDLYNIDEENIFFAVSDGSVTVITHKPGDINDDGSVNNKDVTALFKYLSGWDIVINEEAADINGDGNKNNKDITLLFKYLSGWDVVIH